MMFEALLTALLVSAVFNVLQWLDAAKMRHERSNQSERKEK